MTFGRNEILYPKRLKKMHTSNRLIHETSPYLLQHAHNPVNWYPWSEEALKIARFEDKPIIVSIGYSACHWCHVMERESFEDQDIAAIMNEFFVCIKIDREERPDLDQIYMDAVQAMGVNGGWPLNVFLMPDGKPFYGGTYFPVQHWVALLRQISNAFRKQRNELSKSADNFAQIIAQSEIQKYSLSAQNQDFKIEDLETGFRQMAESFDKQEGGVGVAPKFPMPSIYQFLLRYYQLTQNQEAINQVNRTLEAMALGGIYDQIRGGFARYSVDGRWFAPHFEKMLYDNGQLLSLYSEAYSLTKNPLYKKVVYETIEFIACELTSNESGFFSALDADSEGEEGKFYIWEYEELQQILHENIELFLDYFSIEKEGNWEKNYNILYRKQTDKAFTEKHQISLSELQTKVKLWQSTLSKRQNQRPRPSLDDKILAAWNGLTIKGLANSFAIFGKASFLELAQKNADFILEKMQKNGQLQRSYKNGKSRFLGTLEDYACVIEGLIALYQVSFEEKYLYKAQKLTEYTLTNFYDSDEEFFFYTDKTGEKLIARKKEIFDNVIPASNSIMARNLHHLSLFFERNDYEEIAQKMLAKMSKLIQTKTRFVSNWSSLMTEFLEPTVEIVITGKESRKFASEIHKQFIPNKIICATETESKLPLFQNRLENLEKTTIFVCRDKACLLPVHSVKEALAQL